ncbi:MAG: Uma2 family endonuclease [Abitibacteriaceae bacterium]|nr:Uma2 family endonuclease [Abditibacteriaceae bacterium]MBV9866638.1 Uma2 family endonuclease [Abditibacteriaceae bacterium]
MVETLAALMTADEFFTMSFPDGRAELIQGEVFQMSPAGGEHGTLAMRLGGRLFAYVETHKLGEVCAAETGFIIARNPDTVRAPDTAFISNERLTGVTRPKKFWPFAPDLAVEVVSPGDTAEEIEQKVKDWFSGGTRLVWIAYPSSQTIHIYHSAISVQILQKGDVLTGDDVVPGFSCAVADIFV